MGRDDDFLQHGAVRLQFQFTRPHGARPTPTSVMAGRMGFNSRARMGRDSERDLNPPFEHGFNSRARMGRDEALRSGIRRPSRFNSRARMGRDSDPRHAVNYITFQFTRPHGTRPKTVKCPKDNSGFNSRARMGRDAACACAFSLSLFQFTRPHGARQLSVTKTGSIYVSIHAPAWGATSAMAIFTAMKTFQFTRPHGARPGEVRFKQMWFPVSIHAPAWGATRVPPLPPTPPRFNSRARMGRDTPFMQASIRQSRFNSRARMGRDNAEERGDGLPLVSIHAPAWGATGVDALLQVHEHVSIHAPAWGATGFFLRRVHAHHMFQFTRPHGARP